MRDQIKKRLCLQVQGTVINVLSDFCTKILTFWPPKRNLCVKQDENVIILLTERLKLIGERTVKQNRFDFKKVFSSKVPVSNSIIAPTNSLSINIAGGNFLVDWIMLRFTQVRHLQVSNINSHATKKSTSHNSSCSCRTKALGPWSKGIDFAILTCDRTMSEWWAIVYGQKSRNTNPNSKFRFSFPVKPVFQ